LNSSSHLLTRHSTIPPTIFVLVIFNRVYVYRHVTLCLAPTIRFEVGHGLSILSSLSASTTIERTLGKVLCKGQERADNIAYRPDVSNS
jgi:hypothetical protein